MPDDKEEEYGDEEGDELFEAVAELQDRVLRQDRSLAKYMQMFAQLIRTIAIALDEGASPEAQKEARHQIKQVAINLGSYQNK